MARTRTLAEQAADAYKLADLEGFTDRYPLTEVYRYINQGNAECWDLLVAARGYSYFGKPYWTMGAVTSSGTAPPTVTVSGSPRIGVQLTYVLHVDIVVGGTLGTATFRWSTDAGTTWQTTVATAASYTLPGTGLTLTFATGTYSTDNLYVSTGAVPTCTSGTGTYALPADFYKLHQLWLSDGTRSLLYLEPMYPIDEPGLQMASSNGSGAPSYYQIRDGYFDLFPSPDYAYTIQMRYVPHCPVMTNTTDTFDGINGFEDYGVGFAARRMLLKEGDIEMANLVTQDLNKLKERIITLGADRDKGMPQKVQDVRGALSWKRPVGRRFPRA